MEGVQADMTEGVQDMTEGVQADMTDLSWCIYSYRKVP